MSADSQEPAAAIEQQEIDRQKIERQQMTVDIACVGFGPAMGGFLTTLSRSLLNPDGSVRLESATSPGLPLQVICYERADGLGFGVSGAVTRARGIRGSFPGVDLTADSDGGGGEEGEARLPARSHAGEPPVVHIQGCRPRAALARLPVRAEARCVRAALYSAFHAETRGPRAVARPVQPVGQRSSGSVRLGANLAGHAGCRTTD